MLNLFYKNFDNSKGLPFWNSKQILKRNYIKEYLVKSIQNELLSLNQGWLFEEWEAPIFTPLELINKNYTDDDYFIIYNNINNIEMNKILFKEKEDKIDIPSSDKITMYRSIGSALSFASLPDQELENVKIIIPSIPSYSSMNINLLLKKHTEECKFLAIRPETTMGSYKIAEHLLNNGFKLPLCVYQSGKSFRKEQSDQSMQTHKRFTEFYQLEFQCLYSSNSKADYYQRICDRLPDYIKELTKLEVRLIESDRLPDYSNKTFDIEVKTPEKWLEICSISDRKDYAENIRNVEIAFGLDRLVLC